MPDVYKRQPIKDILLQLFPATLELSLAALAISSVLGSILGILSALKKGSIGDNVLTVFGMIGVSIPQFFFGMLCILVFALDWAILPIGGRMAPGETGIWNHFKYLILPASVLGISLTAGVMRYSRSSMLDTMNKDYIKTARAKGCLLYTSSGNHTPERPGGRPSGYPMGCGLYGLFPRLPYLQFDGRTICRRTGAGAGAPSPFVGCRALPGDPSVAGNADPPLRSDLSAGRAGETGHRGTPPLHLLHQLSSGEVY